MDRGVGKPRSGNKRGQKKEPKRVGPSYFTTKKKTQKTNLFKVKRKMQWNPVLNSMAEVVGGWKGKQRWFWRLWGSHAGRLPWPTDFAKEANQKRPRARWGPQRSWKKSKIIQWQYIRWAVLFPNVQSYLSEYHKQY
jgi:hypothetical protein